MLSHDTCEIIDGVMEFVQLRVDSFNSERVRLPLSFHSRQEQSNNHAIQLPNV